MAIESVAARSAKSKPRVLIPEYRRLSRRTVRLTFDDGPHPQFTDRILQILDRHAVKSTFFMVGQNVAAHPEVAKRVAAAGHRIGNHTYSHPNLARLSAKEIRAQLQRTEKLIAPHLGSSKLFRPPYGSHNQVVDAVAAELGYRLILWNVDTLDWNKKYQPRKWVEHGLDQVRARDVAIVLNHDIHKTTADHLDSFISRIRALGSVKFELQS